MSEIARIVAKFDDTIDYLNKLVKENPNDADLGGKVRKFTKGLSKIKNKY